MEPLPLEVAVEGFVCPHIATSIGERSSPVTETDPEDKVDCGLPGLWTGQSTMCGGEGGACTSAPRRRKMVFWTGVLPAGAQQEELA